VTKRKRLITDRFGRRASSDYPSSRILWLGERQRAKWPGPLGFRDTYGHRGPTFPRAVVMLCTGQVACDHRTSASCELTSNRFTGVHMGRLCRITVVKFSKLDDSSGWGTGRKSSALSVGHGMPFPSCSDFTQSVRRNSEIRQRGLSVRS
jgi:hypothetical protein